jgi:hypothetical protein
MRTFTTASVLLLTLLMFACGGGGGGKTFEPPPPSGSISVSLSSNSAQVFPGDAPVDVTVTIGRTGSTGSVQLAAVGLPSGATPTYQHPGTNNTGSISISAGSAAAGTYAIRVNATDGSLGITTTATLNFTIGVLTQISSSTSGRINLAMSTSFQPAEWSYQFFQQHPSALTPLGDLGAQHIRLQPVFRGIPQRSSTTWDFSYVDAITQPILGVGDRSPQFQIALAPDFMYDSQKQFLDPSFQQFANYTQQLVLYYNRGGFLASDGFHVSASQQPIVYWGIYNEPNFNNMNPVQYTQMYNKVVPAMQAVDPNLKFLAGELGDYVSLAATFMPTFVNGVNAQVDIFATHFYSTCVQADSDAKLFSTIPGFISEINTIQAHLASRPVLANVPIWVTENNVNADYDKGGGISMCTGGPFVADRRGSSAFFAAWRPYVFSQFAKNGVELLHHWTFPGGVQYGQLDDNANKQLSYWVDYTLAQMFPSPPGADILNYTSTDEQNLETLAVRNPDNSVVVMVANRAVANATDNNGAGTPRTIAVDITGLGSFATASITAIESTTNLSTGPETTAVAVSNRILITLHGYGVAFVKLK